MFLFVTPPLTQLNCSYPATSVLVGYLRQEGMDASQMDLSITLMLRVLREQNDPLLDAVVRFLQGKDLTLQNRFANPDMWEGRINQTIDDQMLEDLDYDYGLAGTYNRAQYFATLYLEKVCKDIRRKYSSHFETVRYGEKLCSSLSTFDPLLHELSKAPNQLDVWTIEEFEKNPIVRKLKDHDFVGLSIPFPGNLYGGLRLAQYIKQKNPSIHINMGGGYVSTELRQLSDPRIFDFVDSITFDDGEVPMTQLYRGETPHHTITRATLPRIRELLSEPTPTRWNSATPCLDGLNLNDYMDTADTANPMARLWSNGRWLKLQMAHGCYWHGCTFCDTTLPYIGCYQTVSAATIVDRMESLMEQSGLSGFHFVDEAAPPKLMREVAEEILRRRLIVSWWTNIRFEKTYTPELCQLLAQAGCIAVSGGIEVASERVLKLINKGVSLESVRRTLAAFRDAGILVHAYLMYGFITETESELFDSLSNVRDLFEDGLIQSAFWHRYAMTCHAENEKLTADHQHVDGHNPFANNEVPFSDPKAPDWSRYTRGLNTATYNYMRGTGFDIPIRKWFK